MEALLKALKDGVVFTDNSAQISGPELASLLSKAMLKEYIWPRGLQIRGCIISGVFDIEALKIDFPIYMQDCCFDDVVILRHTHLQSLIFEGTTFEQAVDARDASITGQIVARKCEFKRPILFRDCSITGQINFLGATFHCGPQQIGEPRNVIEEHAWGQTFSFARSSASSLKWLDVAIPRDAILDFSDAVIGSFYYDLSDAEFSRSWPESGGLILQGFKPRRLDRNDSGSDPESVIKWLELASRFSPSAYLNVATALGDDGLGHSKEVVMGELQSREVANIKSTLKRTLYRFVLGVADYGRKPSRPLMMALLCFILATAQCGISQKLELIAPNQSDLFIENCHYAMAHCDKKDVGWRTMTINPGNELRYIPSDYPAFSPVAFSLERFIPMLRLRQVDNWDFSMPWLSYMHRLLASVALFLSGIFIATISGLLKTRHMQES